MTCIARGLFRVVRGRVDRTIPRFVPPQVALGVDEPFFRVCGRRSRAGGQATMGGEPRGYAPVGTGGPRDRLVRVTLRGATAERVIRRWTGMLAGHGWGRGPGEERKDPPAPDEQAGPAVPMPRRATRGGRG